MPRDSPFDIPFSDLLDISHMEFVMSSLDLEQSVAAQKASLEDPFGILNKDLESIEKLTSLTLWAFKIILAKTQEITASGLSTKDSQELLSLQAQTAVNETQSSWHLRP